MPRTPRLEGEKRKRIDVTLNPKMLEAVDAIARMTGISRTDIIECGLCRIFYQFIQLFSESINGVGVDG